MVGGAEARVCRRRVFLKASCCFCRWGFMTAASLGPGRAKRRCHRRGDATAPSFPSMAPSALRFDLVAECAISRARASIIHLPHQSVEAPVFMPVGTQGTMKGVTFQQLRDLGCQIMLGNTYHLGLRPVRLGPARAPSPSGSSGG